MMRDDLGQAVVARELETRMTELVTTAPPAALDLARCRELAERLEQGVEDAFAAERALAAACARALSALERGELAAGPVLLYLASGAAVLATALTARAAGREARAKPLDAARHEIESFLVSGPRAAPPATPDVPLSSLSRGRRSRT
jgi:hypothetical protein